jgi:hypothetical protein
MVSFILSDFLLLYFFLQGRNHREAPVFKVFAELAIPNVTIQPSTDEVQSYLQKAVHAIVAVSKNISQWSKDRQRVSVSPPSPRKKENIIIKSSRRQSTYSF